MHRPRTPHNTRLPPSLRSGQMPSFQSGTSAACEPIYEMEKEKSELMRYISRIEGDIPAIRRSITIRPTRRKHHALERAHPSPDHSGVAVGGDICLWYRPVVCMYPSSTRTKRGLRSSRTRRWSGKLSELFLASPPQRFSRQSRSASFVFPPDCTWIGIRPPGSST